MWESSGGAGSFGMMTYNAWVRLNRLHKIYRYHWMNVSCTPVSLAAIEAGVRQSQSLIVGMLQ